MVTPMAIAACASRVWQRSLLVAIVVLAVPESAWASPDFPPAIEAAVGSPRRLECTLCHATTVGGGPVTTVFGQTMLARGLFPGNVSTLQTALAAIDAERTDSDGDGLADMDELRQGLDPNDPSNASGEEPAYGCGAQIAPGSTGGGGLVALGWGIVLAFCARRRARRSVPGGPSALAHPTKPR